MKWGKRWCLSNLAVQVQPLTALPTAESEAGFQKKDHFMIPWFLLASPSVSAIIRQTHMVILTLQESIADLPCLLFTTVCATP